MIPYEELVVALQTWRARQGLPVGQLSGVLTPPPAAPVRAQGTPPSGPRSAPPAPPTRAPAPPPPAAHAHTDETLDEGSLLDDAAIDEHLAAHIDESHYENEGDNFSIPFDARAAALAAAAEEGDESTAIGALPGAPAVDEADAIDPHGGTKRDEW